MLYLPKTLIVLCFSFVLAQKAHAQVVPYSFWHKFSPTCTNADSYFVATKGTWNGNLGGLTGANEKCLAEVQAYAWKGKPTGCSFLASKVKAFLCDGTSCNNLTASTTYKFAVCDDASAGGDGLTTDASGQGPGNETLWNTLGKFSTTTQTYWTGRKEGSDSLWDNTSNVSHHCLGWTNGTAGEDSAYGVSTGDKAPRWADGENLCNNTLQLVCVIESN